MELGLNKLPWYWQIAAFLSAERGQLEVERTLCYSAPRSPPSP